MVYLGEQIEISLTHKIVQLTNYLEARYAGALVELIPSYCSLMVQYHPRRVDYETLVQGIRAWELLDEPSNVSGKELQLPVYYHPEVAPDLEPVAKRYSLSIEQVIEYHCLQQYTVCAIGFAPGFAFLASVSPKIATPRHDEPRLVIPAGSVGIADQQTAVYPSRSPGGWQIIGNCPQRVFDPGSSPMSPFEVGDTVKFKPIDRAEFVALGGEICPSWK